MTIAFSTELDLGSGVKFSLSVTAGEPQALLTLKSGSGNEINVPLKKDAIKYLRTHFGLVNTYIVRATQKPKKISAYRRRRRR